MLDKCSPGWRVKETDHFYQIMWNGRIYPSFPKAAQVDIGHIRKMIRHLRIDRKCAEEQLETLR